MTATVPATEMTSAEEPGLDFSRRPVILAGHSHVYSMVGFESQSAGFQAPLEFRVDPVRETSRLNVCLGPWPRTAEYWDYLCSLARTPGEFSIAISLLGNHHLARFLIRPATPFDFCSTEFPTLPIDSSTQLVPETLVEAVFSSDYESFRPVIRELVAAKRRIILLGTPPPKFDDGFLRNAISNEEHFMLVCQAMGVSFDRVEFTAPIVRLKLWGLLQALTRRIAVEEGAEFLPVPEMAREEDGSLRREFWSADCTHANCKYGRLVLTHLLDYLNKMEA
jgi:hypothetical protein